MEVIDPGGGSYLHLNNYETAPNIIQLNQNCFYQFLHELILKLWSAEQFYDQLMQELVKTGKFRYQNNQRVVYYWKLTDHSLFQNLL